MTDKILSLDIGNSAITWQFGESEQAGGSVLELVSIKETLFATPDIVYLSCVRRPPQDTAYWQEQVERTWNIVPKIAEVTDGFSGLRLAYKNPSHLGLDRWLALLAVCEHENTSLDACLLIDAGTAVSIDVLADKRQIGGLLVPGLEMMRTSFYSTTAAHQEKKGDIDTKQAYGWDTDSCVRLGTLRMLEEFISALCLDFINEHQKGTIIFSGGNGKALMRSITEKIHHSEQMIYDRYIVCRGLCSYFRILEGAESYK